MKYEMIILKKILCYFCRNLLHESLLININNLSYRLFFYKYKIIVKPINSNNLDYYTKINIIRTNY